jgi:peptidoglycan-associated lipoprotein
LGFGAAIIEITLELRMKKLVFVLALAALLSACGSAVKLDNVPVEDKSGSSVTSAGASGATGGAVNSGGVASVDLGKSTQDMSMQSATRIVYFDYDSFAIRPEFQPLIESHARFMKADKNRKVVIEGHTDERGGREYNLALGQKRSEAVRRALGLLGVPDAQLEAVSFGKEKPAAIGSTDAALEKNRRAEISYR